jgi:hypothetical protein
MGLAGLTEVETVVDEAFETVREDGSELVKEGLDGAVFKIDWSFVGGSGDELEFVRWLDSSEMFIEMAFLLPRILGTAGG